LGKLMIDVSEALLYVEHLRKTTGEKVTVAHVAGKAVAAALAKADGLNGRIVFGKYVPHETVDIAFLVALEDGKDLAKTKITRADEKSIADIARELKEGAGKLREGKDENFEKSKGLLRALPSWVLGPVVWATGFLTSGLGVAAMGLEAFPFGSCIVTNVGSFGLDEGYAPFGEEVLDARAATKCAVREQPVVVEGQVVPRPMLTITATVDHRFIDGAQLAVLAKVVRQGIEKPWTLEGHSEPPWARAGENGASAKDAE